MRRTLLPALVFSSMVGCDVLFTLFPPEPSAINGNWRAEPPGGGAAACLTVASQQITVFANCGGSAYPITANPAATIGGAHVQIQVTYDALPGASVTSAYDLNWQSDGTLTGTCATTLNGTPQGTVNIVWRRQ